MIPKNHITSWHAKAPWSSIDMIEQDLVISRAIVSIFKNSFLQKK